MCPILVLADSTEGGKRNIVQYFGRSIAQYSDPRGPCQSIAYGCFRTNCTVAHTGQRWRYEVLKRRYWQLRGMAHTPCCPPKKDSQGQISYISRKGLSHLLPKVCHFFRFNKLTFYLIFVGPNK